MPSLNFRIAITGSKLKLTIMKMVSFIKSITNKIPYAHLAYRKRAEIKRYRKFHQEFLRFEALTAKTKQRFIMSRDEVYPCFDDDSSEHEFDAHYIYHTAWAARVLAGILPRVHVDISSRMYFSTLVSAFVPVEFYDYRPAKLFLNGLTSKPADLMRLPFADTSVHSLSCMHVVEHIGLGRYGDPLDPDGDLKAMSELNRVLAVGGSLLFVVPVGKPKIMFNAHRIYAYQQIIDAFPNLILEQFALIPDNGIDDGLIYNAPKELADIQEYGCGCFWFKRLDDDLENGK